MYRTVKRPANAARHSKVSQTRFSLIRSVLFCPSSIRRAATRRERRALFPREGIGGWTRRKVSRRAFISPINFTDSGWRKNWVKSRSHISSIFSPIPIIPPREPASVHCSLFILRTGCTDLYEARSFLRDTRSLGPSVATVISFCKLGAVRSRYTYCIYIYISANVNLTDESFFLEA